MGLLLVVRFAGRRQVPARVLAAAWVVIALVWLVPLTIPVRWSPFSFAPGLTASQPAPQSAVEAGFLPAVPVASQVPVRLSDFDRVPANASAPRPAAWSMMRSSKWLTAAWLGIAGGLLAMRGLSMVRLNRKLRHGTTALDASVERAFRAAGVELGLRRLPRIVMTDLVSSPALCGVLRARLLFPSHLAGELSEAELRWVMLHELGHYQRRDLWVLSLLHLAAAVQWFNPLAWLAIRLGVNDTELACDDFVLRHAAGAEPSEYGDVLLKVLSAQQTTVALPAAVGIVENKRQLLRRFAMISNFRPVSVTRAVISIALVSGFALIGLTQEKPAEQSGPAVPHRLPELTAEQHARMKDRRARVIEWEEHANLELRAVAEVGGVPLAIVDVEGEPVLVSRQSGIMGLRVGEIDVATRQVTMLTRSGNARVLNIMNPETVKFPQLVADRFLTPQAQARRRESMRGEAVPHELALAWPKINREGKIAILMSYLQGAEVVQIFRAPEDGGITVSTGFLFAEQLQAINRERRDRFIASLTPEQKAGFTPARAIHFVDPPDQVQQQMAEAKKANASREKVLASLTPEQRALYNVWMGQGQEAQK